MNPVSDATAPQTPITMTTLQIGNQWLQEYDGGLERFYFELLRHLPATGTDYKGLVVGTEAVRKMTGGNVVSFAKPTELLPWRLFQCRRVGESLGKVDLISVHFGLYGLPWLDQIGSKPSVIQFQGSWAGESGVEGAAGINERMKRLIETQVYRRARRLLVLSHAFKQELVTRYGIDEGIVRIVPGGVDIDRFNMTLSKQEARERLGWPRDRFIALSVRRQVRRMGLENLIDAARTLVKKRPDLLIFLGGTGPISGELDQRIQEYGLQDHVKRLGRVSDDDLPLAYRAADLSIVPSQFLEGFGLITLESMASGTPVLVTPVGGLPETVLPFAPQCVFANTSTKEIEGVFGEFLEGNRTLPDAHECRRYAVAGFSWPHVSSMVRSVYDEAMG